jgi:N-acetylneuraminic acid mutarotase
MDDKAKKITEHKVPKRPQFQWKKWRKESPAPVKRCGHVTVADKESNDVKLYLLGGTSNPLYPPVDNEPIPDVWVYSLRNELWTQLSFPTVPVLCYSAALQIDHKLLVVGGWNRGPVNGTFVLDTLRIDQGWKILQTKNPPPARHTHTLTLCDKMIYLFGGIDKAGKRYGDLHELEPIACEWEEIRALNGPVPRSQHSMVACDHYLYIFGGRDGMDRILSDFWCFDTINRKWRQLESPTSTLWYIEGTRLTGPFVIEDRKYLALLHGYSFENIFLFDIKEGKWQSHKCVGDIPSNRGYFTATLMTNHEALIFGGQDDNGTLNDLYSLYLCAHQRKTARRSFICETHNIVFVLRRRCRVVSSRCDVAATVTVVTCIRTRNFWHQTSRATTTIGPSSSCISCLRQHAVVDKRTHCCCQQED